MFKLVGRETFEINKRKCVISVDAIGIFAYEYSLSVDGKAYEKFQEQQRKALQVWNVPINGVDTRICLGLFTFKLHVLNTFNWTSVPFFYRKGYHGYLGQWRKS